MDLKNYFQGFWVDFQGFFKIFQDLKNISKDFRQNNDNNPQLINNQK